MYQAYRTLHRRVFQVQEKIADLMGHEKAFIRKGAARQVGYVETRNLFKCRGTDGIFGALSYDV